LDVKWKDGKSLDDGYDFFIVSNEAKNGWVFQSEIADRIFTEKSICSVRYDVGRVAYVMMNKAADNHSKLKEYLKEISDDFRCTPLNASDLKSNDEAILIQLLINSLSRIEVESLVYNNLTGKYLLFNPEWRYYNKKTDTIVRMYGLEFKVERSGTDDSKLALGTHVMTFTKCSELFNEKKFKKPQYSLEGTILKRTFGYSDDNYVVKGNEKHKNNVDYLTFDPKRYLSCRCKLLDDLIKKVNCKYGAFVELSFSHMRCLINEKPPRDATSSFRKLLHDRISSENVCIVRAYDDELVSRVCLSIQQKMNEELGLDVRISSAVMSNCLNIRVIHSPEYCKDNGIFDRYNDDLTGFNVQHIIAERYAKTGDSASDVVLKELIIKKDLKEGSISIENWSDRSFKNDITFVMFEKRTEDDIDHVDVYAMTVHPSGLFVISGPEDASESDVWFDIAYDKNGSVDIPDGVVIMDGKINVIRDTGVIPLPVEKELQDAMDLLDQLRSEGNAHTRGQKTPRSGYSRDNIIHSLMDLKLISDGKMMFYMSGYDSNNIKSTYSRAPHLRKVIPYDCDESFMDEVLSLMNVPFVRFGGLTVLPYPFKPKFRFVW